MKQIEGYPCWILQSLRTGDTQRQKPLMTYISWFRSTHWFSERSQITKKTQIPIWGTLKSSLRLVFDKRSRLGHDLVGKHPKLISILPQSKKDQFVKRFFVPTMWFFSSMNKKSWPLGSILSNFQILRRAFNLAKLDA